MNEHSNFGFEGMTDADYQSAYSSVLREMRDYATTTYKRDGTWVTPADTVKWANRVGHTFLKLWGITPENTFVLATMAVSEARDIVSETDTRRAHTYITAPLTHHTHATQAPVYDMCMYDRAGNVVVSAELWGHDLSTLVLETIRIARSYDEAFVANIRHYNTMHDICVVLLTQVPR